VRDPFTADRSLTLLARTSAPSAESTLLAWAILALLVVLATLVIGGPS
jgi:hypothetical protein